MARKHKHEEHANHEAWAIPYGDLVTLLLAFFVVMYAMSTVNEGKYRVLSDSLVAAFRGPPKTLQPIQVGDKQVGSGADIEISIVQQAMLEGQPRHLITIEGEAASRAHQASATQGEGSGHAGNEGDAAGHASGESGAASGLMKVEADVEQAMQPLIDKNLVVVRRTALAVEVEIRTDILFPSGSATVAVPALSVLQQLADTLKQFPNPIRVEGHTDNRPIKTLAFPSNWELSAGRAATVVHLMTERGVDPSRLTVIGLGEYRPIQSNDTVEGRNANRRVLLVIQGMKEEPKLPTDKSAESTSPEPAPVNTPTAEKSEPIAPSAPQPVAKAVL